jgi:drug/metabolite transporter (DMT)-like permease
VQPLLATSVVFSLPLGAKLGHRRVGRRELTAALAVTGGLAAFLVLANPGGGRDDATTAAWLVSFALAAVLCGPLVLIARGRAPALRAALVGSAVGILFGLSAALTKATVERLDDGVLSVLGDWHLYALVVVGYVSMTLSQSSLQAGSLAPAVATQMAIDPVTSLLLGTLAFDETIHDTTAGMMAAVAGILVMVAGIAYLAAAQEGQASAEPAAAGSTPKRA